MKEEKMNPVGPDPGGGDDPPNKGLQDDLLLNGTDIKLENPSTPLLDPKVECPPDIPPLSDLSHPDFNDCKPQMNPYCYQHFNNMPGGNSGPPGDYGPHGPPMMPGFPPQPTPTKQQPSTLEAQYMQQQSQLFIFTTKLANKATEAVLNNSRQYPSIIAYHMAQSATRKFLEKNPYKMNNFGRQFQGNPNWAPNPAPTGKKGSKSSMQMPMSATPPNQGMGDFNMQQGPPPPPWNNPGGQKDPQGFQNFYDGRDYCGPGSNPGGPMCIGPLPPGGPMGLSPGPNMDGPNNSGPPNYFPGPGGPNMADKVRTCKIPDSDLTPQQRLHREEQLAKMRKMQQILFPENDHPHTPGEQNCPMPHDNLDSYNMPGGPGNPGGMGMEYMGPGGPQSNKGPMGNEWTSPSGGYFEGQPPMKNLGPPGMGNGPRGKGGGGSIPSPATPLTPSSSCGGLPHRPSPHSPMSSDPLYSGGHYYPSGYYSPQVGQVQENSPTAAVQRKDSESSNSEGGKSRKEKSSCSISPTSSAPPSVKEANLMPVPSPQQIQYLNVFEGQELTIQKQPNVGITDPNAENSPGLPPSSLDMNPSTPTLGGQQKPSHSAPPTPVSMSSMSNQKQIPDMSLSSKGRPGSVGPVVTPKNSTTPNPSPQGLDRNSQPGTPLQMNLEGMKNPGNGGFGSGLPGGGQPRPCGNMMKQGIPLGLDFHEGQGKDVPLSPNQDLGPPGAKPGFDPISSMVQMSQQIGGNSSAPNPSGSGMGGNGGFGMNTPGGPPMNPNMVNFNTSMHSVQNVDGGMAMGGPQTVNNTYVNATMTIQQMNIQNIPPYMNPGGNMGPMNHGMGGHMGQNMGPMSQMSHMGPMGPAGPSMGPQGPPVPNMQQQMGPGPPMGSPMGPQMGPMSSMCGGSMGGRGVPPAPQMYGNQPPRLGQGVRNPQYRMPPNPSGPRAFGGTNIQVKPNAPNTIQYLPARPPPPHNQPQMCSQSNVMSGPSGPRSGPNLDFLQRYTNPNPGPVVNVNMGMNVNVNMGGNRMGYPGGPPPSGPCGPMRGPHPGMMESGGPPGNPQLPPSMMNQGGMKGPGSGVSYMPGPPTSPTSDPSFHHFQQRLYATGSNNGNRGPMQGNVQTNPNNPNPNQGFFK